MIFSWTSSLVWLLFCLAPPVSTGPVLGVIPFPVSPLLSACCRERAGKESFLSPVTADFRSRAGPGQGFSSRAGP